MAEVRRAGLREQVLPSAALEILLAAHAWNAERSSRQPTRDRAQTRAGTSRRARMTESVAHPAEFTMHTPNGPVHCCVKHARQMEQLYARAFGLRLPATKAPDEA